MKSPIIYKAYLVKENLFNSFFEICRKNVRGVSMTVNDSTYYTLVSGEKYFDPQSLECLIRRLFYELIIQ